MRSIVELSSKRISISSLNDVNPEAKHLEALLHKYPDIYNEIISTLRHKYPDLYSDIINALQNKYPEIFDGIISSDNNGSSSTSSTSIL